MSAERMRVEHMSAEQAQLSQEVQRLHRPQSLEPYRIMLSFFLVNIGHWMAPALLSMLLSARGVDASTIGLLASTPWLTLILVSFALPRSIRRYGPLFVYRIGILLALVSVIGYLGSLNNLPLLFVSAMIAGVSFSIVWVIADSWVVASAPVDQRGFVVGSYEALAGLALGAGPALLALTGASGTSPWYVLLLLPLLALLPVLDLPKRTLPIAERSSILQIIGYARLYPFVSLIAFMAGMLESAAATILPIYGLSLGLSERSAALLMAMVTVGSISLQVPLGLLADKFTARRAINLLVIAIATVMIILPFLTHGVWTWVAFFLWGGFVTGAYILAVLEANEVGLYTGDLIGMVTVVVTTYTLGSVIGPALGGLTYDLFGGHGFFFSLAACMIGTHLLLLFVQRPRQITQTAC